MIRRFSEAPLRQLLAPFHLDSTEVLLSFNQEFPVKSVALDNMPFFEAIWFNDLLLLY